MLILKMLCHPNISQLYETLSTIHNFYIIMEYIEGGDLFEYISNNKYLSEIESCIFFRQLISSVEYLTKLNISHRDIKPENILLDSEKKNIKLIDFGLSNFIVKNEKLKSSCGSPCYASPEMISGKPYNGIYTDIWSCGIVLYCMLVGALPFDDEDIHILYQQIRDGKFYLPSTLSNEAIDLLKKLLIVDPEKRISIEDIKKHSWFNIDKCILYKGIILTEKKIVVDLKSISEIKKKFFNDEKDVSEDDICNMVKNNNCNKYTSTYYLYRKSKKLRHDEFKERSHSANNKNNNKVNNENVKKNLNKKDNKSMNVFVINNIISTDNNSKNVTKSIVNNNLNVKKNDINQNKKDQSKSKSKNKIIKKKKNINIDNFTDTLRKLKTKISNKSYTPINKKVFSTSFNSTFSNYYPLTHNIKGIKVNKVKLNATDNLKDTRNNSNLFLNTSNVSGDFCLKRDFSHPLYKNGKFQIKKDFIDNKFSLVKHIFKKENVIKNNSKNSKNAKNLKCSKNNHTKKKSNNIKVIYMNTSNEKIPLNLSGFNSKNNFFHSENAKRKNSPILKKNENNKYIGLSRNKGKEKTKQEVLKKLYLP